MFIKDFQHNKTSKSNVDTWTEITKQIFKYIFKTFNKDTHFQ